MATLSIEIPQNVYTKLKTKDINSYLERLIQEDMLLSEIQESKDSGIHTLNSLSDLDD